MKDRPAITRSIGTALATTLLAICPAAFALSPVPPQPDDELLPLLYETLGGENWHNNDGWLDPEVHWCDWYGVDCGQEFWPGLFEFKRLELPDNNLEGELTAELSELLLMHVPPQLNLDLSGNSISGELHHYPRLTDTVVLSDNSFSGPLPPLEGDWVLRDDQRLMLNRNAFSGSVPQSWSKARIWMLDLSDNELTGGHHYVFGNASDFIYFTGNPLEGEIGREVLTSSITPRGQSNIGGGIDICFTDLTVSDPDVEQWLAAHHTASADYEQCLGRDRTEVDATISGSWFNPLRSGEGVSVMMLDSGAPLLYSFSFDTQGNQQWLFELGTAGDQWATWDALQETRGMFGEGIAQENDYTFIRSLARFRFDRVGRDTVSLHRHYNDLSVCGPWVSNPGPWLCWAPLHADRMDYRRLTELAGTTCDNQSEFQQYSGAWYNPERSGEGFVIEVLPDDRVVVYWFTYTPDGSGQQAWMIGQGMIGGPLISEDPPPQNPIDASVEIENVIQPTGGTFGPEFDAEAIEHIGWGRMYLHFREDGRTGFVHWNTEQEAFGSGGYDIERLARPMLAECEEGEQNED